jgi:hypothetical protein
LHSQYERSIAKFFKDYNTKRENSSAGRARPCQGRGRGFEPRFSLYYQNNCLSGGIGRHAGLKIQWVVMPVRVQVPP